MPNPFFGNPNAGTFASRATIERNQLLRPFPQFLNVNQAETNLGKSQYHAGVIQIRKRMTWWSGSFSYTYSRLWDNQFGQGNYYTSRARPAECTTRSSKARATSIPTSSTDAA